MEIIPGIDFWQLQRFKKNICFQSLFEVNIAGVEKFISE